MAQLLIRKRPHWTNGTKPAEWSEAKWRARPSPGDIVEVREDGYWRCEATQTGLRHWPREVFALVQVTTLSVDEAKRFQGGYVEFDKGKNAKRFKSRFRLAHWDAVPWVVTPVVVGGATQEEWSYTCASLSASMALTDKAAL